MTALWCCGTKEKGKMTEEEAQEFVETVNRLEPAERDFMVACITGEGFDEAFDRLKKEKNVEDN